MIKFLIQRPIAIFMATLAFLLMGLVASKLIPTSLMPDIPIPEISVQLSYPGNTARELETNLVRPLRNQLLQVAKLSDIHSSTQDGMAILDLSFDYGTNTDLAFIEVNEKVDAAMTHLPRDLERPKVIKASATDIPIVNLTVALQEDYSDERFLELSEFSESVIKKRIEQLPNVALADLSGLTQGEVIVRPMVEQLQSLGVSSNILVDAIRLNNLELGNLTIKNGIYQYNLKVANLLRNKQDIENINLNIHGQIFKLKELAKVDVLPAPDRGLIYMNGKRAIVLSIIKQADARVYDLKKDLELLTQSFVEEYPNLEFTTNQDQSKLLKLSIDNLKSSLWIGSSLAILIMFFFLQDFKSPLIIAISIPVSLVVSLFFMYLSGLSINIISLSGLILGVGMMIDNAIIVIDNITQKLEDGKSLLEACTEGTNEIITPLISSVLTTCSVFLPLLFLSGISGALFYDQAMAVAIGLSASLMVSIFLIPVVYRQIKNRQWRIEKWLKLGVKTGVVERWYEQGYYFFFKRKAWVFAIAFMGIGMAVVFFKILPYSQIPKLNQNEFILELDWNNNITVAENRDRIHEFVSAFPGLETVYAKVGEQQFLLQKENGKSFSQATIYFKATATADLHSIKRDMTNQLLRAYPRASFKLEEPKNIFQQLFGTEKPPLLAEIISKTGQEVPVEEDLKEIQVMIKEFSKAKIPLKQTAFIEILEEKVLLYDVSYQGLVDELKRTCNQHFIGSLRAMQRFIPIKVAYQQTSFDKIIREAFVKNENNELIALRNLIRIHSAEQYKTIEANRGGEYLPFAVDDDKEVNTAIAGLKAAFQHHRQFDVRFGGSYFDLRQLGYELLIVVLVAIFLLYFIMAAQFESLWQPLIILLEIPIDLGGALLFLWLFGGSINVMAAIGMVVMSGVIINDSILKLHTINLLRKDGYSVKDAIKIGGAKRMKPILMTSLTTILALLPFLFLDGLGAELQRPLALTVIGGMLIGTFISLYFIPIMYYLLCKKQNEPS